MIDLVGALRRLEEVETRFRRLEDDMGRPEVYSNPDLLREVSKERADLEDRVNAYREYRDVARDIQENEELSKSDAGLREMAEDELGRLRPRREELEKRLIQLLVPEDPLDKKDIFLEIRAGTGGDEAALFAADLFRMYARFAERRKWEVVILSISETELKGVKEVIAQIRGRRVYSHLKFEGGVHRVQRVPETEAQGRIHTSAVTVAILPEVEDVDIKIDEGDLRVDTYRASGAGGQHINKTDSAVRLTHIPTGIVVACQDERSQLKNRAKAMKVLRARMAEAAREEAQKLEQDARRAMVGTGDRSERIRTYNFPQNRLTDHRIGLTLYKLESIMEGDMEDLLSALQAYFAAQALAAD
jgi:peptide chain release factor 1